MKYKLPKMSKKPTNNPVFSAKSRKDSTKLAQNEDKRGDKNEKKNTEGKKDAIAKGNKEEKVKDDGKKDEFGEKQGGKAGKKDGQKGDTKQAKGESMDSKAGVRWVYTLWFGERGRNILGVISLILHILLLGNAVTTFLITMLRLDKRFSLITTLDDEYQWGYAKAAGIVSIATMLVHTQTMRIMLDNSFTYTRAMQRSMKMFCTVMFGIMTLPHLIVFSWVAHQMGKSGDIITGVVLKAIQKDYMSLRRVKETIDSMQIDLQCCGVNSWYDWIDEDTEWIHKLYLDPLKQIKPGEDGKPAVYAKDTIPFSCCSTVWPKPPCTNENVRPSVSNPSLWEHGCVTKILKTVEEDSDVLLTLSACAFILEIAGFLLARYLQTNIDMSSPGVFNDEKHPVPGYLCTRFHCCFCCSQICGCGQAAQELEPQMMVHPRNIVANIRRTRSVVAKKQQREAEEADKKKMMPAKKVEKRLKALEEVRYRITSGIAQDTGPTAYDQDKLDAAAAVDDLLALGDKKPAPPPPTDIKAGVSKALAERKMQKYKKELAELKLARKGKTNEQLFLPEVKIDVDVEVPQDEMLAEERAREIIEKLELAKKAKMKELKKMNLDDIKALAPKPPPLPLKPGDGGKRGAVRKLNVMELPSGSESALTSGTEVVDEKERAKHRLFVKKLGGGLSDMSLDTYNEVAAKIRENRHSILTARQQKESMPREEYRVMKAVSAGKSLRELSSDEYDVDGWSADEEAMRKLRAKLKANLKTKAALKPKPQNKPRLTLEYSVRKPKLLTKLEKVAKRLVAVDPLEQEIRRTATAETEKKEYLTDYQKTEEEYQSRFDRLYKGRKQKR